MSGKESRAILLAISVLEICQESGPKRASRMTVWNYSTLKYR